MNVVTRTRVVTPSNFANSPFGSFQKRFASKKQGGKSRNGRDSNPKYLGMKRNHGQEVTAGQIIRRQKGSVWHAGEGAGMGRDFTVFAARNGFVSFERVHVKLGHLSKSIERKFIHIREETPNPIPKQDIR